MGAEQRYLDKIQVNTRERAVMEQRLFRTFRSVQMQNGVILETMFDSARNTQPEVESVTIVKKLIDWLRV